MHLKVFSIRDSKAGAFSNPWFQVNAEVAVRAFDAMAKDPTTNIGKWPEDYTLFELGVWDPEKGTIQMHDFPVNLGIAKSAWPNITALQQESKEDNDGTA